MEAEVLDSKKFFIRTLNVDTRFRSTSILSMSTNFAFHLPNPLKNIIRIRLVTYEIPNTEYIFTYKKNNCSLTITDVFGEHMLSILPGNPTIEQIIAQLQQQLDTLTGEYNILQENGKVVITSQINFTLKLDVPELSRRDVEWGLAYYLGFRRKIYEGNDTYRAEAIPSLRGNSYYFIEIADANGMNSRGVDDSNLQVFTKILVDKPWGETLIGSASQTYRQEFVYQQPINIPKLNIRLLDKYGCEVDLNGADWSMTLELTEITDFEDYRKFTSRYEDKPAPAWGAAIHANMFRRN